MPPFDRFTTEHWTISFPSDWIDRSESDEAPYFESPQGDKGLYVKLWRMSDQEHLDSRTLVQHFQEVEFQSFFSPKDAWELIHRTTEGDESSASGLWEGINGENKYWICGKQIAAGNYVLRATFHDYYSADASASREFFSIVMDSLALTNI
ncbi:hypothetical protein [Pseudoxanthomonas sp. GM95]|uniref:hypothetical protein n=1 Tax=Pseudoxanthomonas sp. GM95 TaxID=1881043 RepID=UPI001113352A|nr:hypothetical protein [Pseudoxanthomonas sp. GM95]